VKNHVLHIKPRSYERRKVLEYFKSHDSRLWVVRDKRVLDALQEDFFGAE